MLENYKDIITVEDLMEILQIGKNTAYRMLQTKEIPSRKFKTKYIIPKMGVIHYISSIYSE